MEDAEAVVILEDAEAVEIVEDEESAEDVKVAKDMEVEIVNLEALEEVNVEVLGNIEIAEK